MKSIHQIINDRFYLNIKVIYSLLWSLWIAEHEEKRGEEKEEDQLPENSQIGLTEGLVQCDEPSAKG